MLCALPAHLYRPAYRRHRLVSDRWNAAFSSILWPIAGLIFLPWTTMAWVFMSTGGVNGLDWIVVGLAFLLDIGAFGGGGYSRRHRD